MMVPVEGTEETLPCELLLIAAGFTGCEDQTANAFDVRKSPRGTIDAGNADRVAPAAASSARTPCGNIFAGRRRQTRSINSSYGLSPKAEPAPRKLIRS